MSLVDLSNVEAQKGFAPMPAGPYLVQCEEASVESTSAGDGQYIKVKLNVKGPLEFENRKVFTNFNIQNPSEQAQEIGLSQLKSFLECSGVKDPNKLEDVNHLVGLVCTAHLKVKKSEQYGDQNEVSYFKEADESDDAPKMNTKEKLPF